MEDEQRRLIFVEMLPNDIAVYVKMSMNLHPTFHGLAKFVKDYARVVAHQEAITKQKPLFKIETREQAPPTAEEYDDEVKISQVTIRQSRQRFWRS